MKKIYLIGENINYSLSPRIYGDLGLECEIKNIASEEGLKDFIYNKEYLGFNVTIPYKEKIAKYLDEFSDIAKKTGVINTVKNESGKLIGYNTDYYGISQAFAEVDFDKKKIILLGSGATSKTVQEYLKGYKCEQIVISRKSRINNYQQISQHYDADIIINTTPISGANYPTQSLVDVEEFKNLECVLDVNYLPNKTQLARNNKAKYLGGLPMLIHQALKSYEIYTNKKATIKGEDIEKRILFEVLNISLIGHPYAGKTTIAKEIAKKLHRRHIDIDQEIAKKEGNSIAEIFANKGEEYFRKQENKVLEQFAYKSSQVISTGGGIVLNDDNIQMLRANSVIVELRSNREIKITKDRPLITKRDDFEKLKQNRADLYEKASDILVYNDDAIDKVAEDIIKKVREYINEKNTNN